MAGSATRRCLTVMSLATAAVFIGSGGKGLAVASQCGEARLSGAGFESVDDIRAVAVANEYVYLAAGYDGLLVTDVSDPCRPVEVGRMDTPGFAGGVAFAGELALVADGYHGIRLIDIERASDPVEVGWVAVRGWANDVAVAGEFALVAAGGGLVVIDFGQPLNPVEVAAVEIDGGGRWVVVADSYACVTDDRGRLHVIDLSEPTAPVEIEVFDPMEFIDGTPSIKEPACVAGLTADRNRQSLKWIDAMVFD